MKPNFRVFSSMISTSNDYSNLKWPLITNAVLIIISFLLLIVSYQSDSWFNYESVNLAPSQTSQNATVEYTHLLEYGSLGLWSICSHRYNDPNAECVFWTGSTRPQFFNAMVILMSCSLYLTTLTIFPSWVSFILILYNTNNQYVKYINIAIWIVFGLTAVTACVLIAVLVLTLLTTFASSKRMFMGSVYITFTNGFGLNLLVAGKL